MQQRNSNIIVSYQAQQQVFDSSGKRRKVDRTGFLLETNSPTGSIFKLIREGIRFCMHYVVGAGEMPRGMHWAFRHCS